MFIRRLALFLCLFPHLSTAQDASFPLTSPSTAAAPGTHQIVALESNGTKSLALISTVLEGAHLSVANIDAAGVAGPMIWLGEDRERWQDPGFRRSIARFDDGFVVVRECGEAHAPSICADTIKGNTRTTRIIVPQGLTPRIAFNGTTYALVFRYHPSHPAFHILRLDANLQPIGASRLIEGARSEPEISPLGNSFYMVWRGGSLFEPAALYGQAVDSSGALAPPLKLGDRWGTSLAFDGETLAALFYERNASGGSELKVSFLKGSTWSAARTLPASPTLQAHTAISAAPSGFVVSFTDVSESSSVGVRAITISDAGESLHEFEVGEGKTGEERVLPLRRGSNLLFVWSFVEEREVDLSWWTDATLRARVLSPSGAPASPVTTASISSAHQDLSSTIFTGSGYLVAAEEFTGEFPKSSILLTAFDRNGNRLSDRQPVKSSTYSQLAPRLVSGPSGAHLLLFAESEFPRSLNDNPDAKVLSRLYGALVDDSGSTQVEPFLIAEGADDLSNATWNGSEWVVVWSTKDRPSHDRNGTLRLSRVHTNGTVAAQSLPLTFNHESRGDAAPAIAWSGDRYLVVWEADYYTECRVTCIPTYSPELRARRLDANFTILDPQPLVLSELRSVAAPFVIWNGEKFVVAATRADYNAAETILQSVDSNGELGATLLIDPRAVPRGLSWNGARHAVLLDRYPDVELALVDRDLTEITSSIRIASTPAVESAGSLAGGPGGEYFAVFGSQLSEAPMRQRLFATIVDGLPMEALAPPTDLRVLADEARIYLEWTDNSSVEEGFELEYRSETGEFKNLGSVPANTTAVFVRAFPSIGTYRFRVRATTSRHSSLFSNEATAFIEVADAAPDNLTIERRGKNSITLRWSDQSEGETGFVIEVTEMIGGVRRTLFAPKDSETFIVTALRASAAYSFRVRAALGSDVTDASNEVTGSTTSRPRIIRPTSRNPSPRAGSTESLQSKTNHRPNS